MDKAMDVSHLFLKTISSRRNRRDVSCLMLLLNAFAAACADRRILVQAGVWMRRPSVPGSLAGLQSVCCSRGPSSVVISLWSPDRSAAQHPQDKPAGQAALSPAPLVPVPLFSHSRLQSVPSPGQQRYRTPQGSSMDTHVAAYRKDWGVSSPFD